jgi:tricorn protease interacting factor F2/3
MEKSHFRLPNGVKPLNYELFFEPDLTNFNFHGKEKIDLKITKQTKEIILNSSNLDIKNVKLMYKSEILNPEIEIDEKSERAYLKFGKKLSKGFGQLTLEFSGKLKDDLVGLYRSEYTTPDGSEKYMATTQFEATYARRAFPCFDEPDKKASFELSVKIDKNLQAISNMPIIEEIEEGNKKYVKFDKTLPMSTYLLYLGVGEFEFLEDKFDDILLRVATTPGKKGQGKFALDLAKKFLSFYQEYSGIKYPLPKLDLVAIPDFAAGAMENWGAITFREVLLLFDPKKSSTPIKKNIAEVIAHELWHQWSGNLVTMKWWNDLWLNESFATYMAYKAVDNFFPEWRMVESFIYQKPFSSDSLRSTHPIEVEIKSPNEIEEIFDEISYEKGGSVLQMIEGYLGEENFRKGVSYFLSRYKYSSATSKDFWNSLSKLSDKPVKKIMESWVRQAGYPLVEATLKGSKLHLKQKRFLYEEKG